MQNDKLSLLNKIELSILKFKEKMFPHFQFADAEMTKLERYPGKGIFKFLDKKTNLFKKNNYLPDWKYKKTK